MAQVGMSLSGCVYGCVYRGSVYRVCVYVCVQGRVVCVHVCVYVCVQGCVVCVVVYRCVCTGCMVECVHVCVCACMHVLEVMRKRLNEVLVCTCSHTQQGFIILILYTFLPLLFPTVRFRLTLVVGNLQVLFYMTLYITQHSPH